MIALFLVLTVQAVNYIVPNGTLLAYNNLDSTIASSVEFADWLYAEEDYNSAIIEYKRILFRGIEDSSKILLRLGQTHLHLKQYSVSRKYFSKIQDDTASFLMGLSYLKTCLPESSKTYFIKIKDDSLRNKTKSEYSGFFCLPYKNCALAGILSTIVPGLGRAYTGRKADGLYSFLLTIGSIAISYRYYKTEDYILSGITGGVGALFYLGDIYGSIESVKAYNARIFNQKLSLFENKFAGIY